MTKLFPALSLSVLAAVGFSSGWAESVDPFERIKQELEDAACCEVQFLSIVHSEVFDSVDSTAGNAYIADDGRYALTIGTDTYVQTADRLYSYSRDQNQVTVEWSDPRMASSEEVSFLNRLDDFYRTDVAKAGREYKLALTDTTATNLPSKMTVHLSKDGHSIDYLEFKDINDDLNRIAIHRLEPLRACDSSALAPVFPDSVEVIELN